MRGLHSVLLTLLPAVVVLTGCGRPTLPGGALRGERARSSISEPRTEAPKQAFVEAGPADAKVRVIAFYAIDTAHKPVIEAITGLAKQFPGKVYAKYVDPATPEGAKIAGQMKQEGNCVLINGESSIVLENAKPAPRSLNFGGEMGRYWTAEDLKAAVAQEVAKAYQGK